MTAPQLDRLAAELDALAETAAPPSGVDIAGAVRLGRRRLRRRRIAGAGTAAVLVAAIALVALGLPSGGRAAPPARPQPTPVGTDEGGGDPVTGFARFGWLPPTVSQPSYLMFGAERQTRVQNPVLIGHIGNGVSIVVTRYGKGVTPHVGKGDSDGLNYAMNASDVNGRRAYWVSQYRNDSLNGGVPTLRWLMADGRWAELRATYLPPQGLPATVLRVAAGVTFPDQPLPLPIYVTGLPAGAESRGVQMAAPSGAGKLWGVRLDYRVGAYTFSVSAGPPDPALKQGPNYDIVCAMSHGIQVCVDNMNTAKGTAMPPSLVAFGGLQGMLKRTVALGEDPRTWSTDFIR